MGVGVGSGVGVGVGEGVAVGLGVGVGEGVGVCSGKALCEDSWLNANIATTPDKTKITTIREAPNLVMANRDDWKDFNSFLSGN